MMLRRLHILACAKARSCALGPFSVGYTMSISGHLRALTEFLRTTGVAVDQRDAALLQQKSKHDEFCSFLKQMSRARFKRTGCRCAILTWAYRSTSAYLVF